MTARNLLHVSRVQEFATWCETVKGLKTRPRDVGYEILQVQPKGSTLWHTLFRREHMPEHVTVPWALEPLVLNFIRSTKS